MSSEELYREIDLAVADCDLARANAEFFELSSLYSARMGHRDAFVTKFGWCIPSREMIQTLADFIGKRSVLSVAAGNALLEHLLQEAGVDVIATDDKSSWRHERNKVCEYMPVESIDAVDAVMKHRTDVLLMIWPPYDDPLAHNALKEFKGRVVVYIGEDYGGCTADDGFHEELKKWTQVRINIPMRNWYGIHDFVQIYERS